MNFKNIFTSQNRIYLFFLLIILTAFSCSKSVRTSSWNGSQSVICNGKDCTAVGAYNLHSIFGGGLPLGAFSINHGQSFITSNQFLLLGSMLSLDTTEAIAVNCNNQHCVAVGTYNLNITGDGTAFPFAAISDDGGQTFFSNITQPLLPLGANLSSTLSELDGITCRENFCVAVGIYNLNLHLSNPPPQIPSGGLPLILVSHDGGITFTTRKAVLPNDADTINGSVFLYGVSCYSDSNCVAVGTYNVSYSNGTSLPYAVMSLDGGQNFNKVSTISLPSDQVPQNEQYSKLRAITCQEQRCIGVGFYNANFSSMTGTGFPLIVLSNDGGKTFPIAYQPSIPNADTTQAIELTGIDCFEDRCVAVGNYNITFMGGNPKSGLPLILISNNSGESFTQVTSPHITLPNDADPSKPVLLTGVNCTEEHCIVVGGYNLEYMYTNLDKGIPLVLISNESGESYRSFPVLALPSTGGGAIFGLSNQF